MPEMDNIKTNLKRFVSVPKKCMHMKRYKSVYASLYFCLFWHASNFKHNIKQYRLLL